jgi:hypothetical protein
MNSYLVSAMLIFGLNIFSTERLSAEVFEYAKQLHAATAEECDKELRLSVQRVLHLNFVLVPMTQLADKMATS